MNRTPEAQSDNRSVHSMMIQVQKRFEGRMNIPGMGIDGLFRGLAHQTPNRVYYNPVDGNITRGVLFEERTHLLGAYLQRLAFIDGIFKPIDEIELTSENVNDRERKILQWKEGFGMTGNLVLNPDVAFRVISPRSPRYVVKPDPHTEYHVYLDEFVHTAETEQGLLYYRFEWNDRFNIPRTLSIGFGMDELQRYTLEPMERPTADVVRYSQG